MHRSPRTWFMAGVAVCVALLLAAYYFQHAGGLEPCPLCISQRIVVLVTGVVFLIAALHNPRARALRIYAWLGGITALSGAAISARHVWLQYLPKDAVPSCGPGLEYMLQNFPLSQVIPFFFSGTGDCAEVDWRFAGLTMPGWLLLIFIGLAVLSLVQLRNLPRRR